MYTETAYPVIDLAKTGRRIERQRREAGLTVRDLQAYFGFEYPQAIYKWQHGECLPTVDNLLALSRLLRVSMEDLLVYEDQGVSHFYRIFPACRTLDPFRRNKRNHPFLLFVKNVCEKRGGIEHAANPLRHRPVGYDPLRAVFRCSLRQGLP